MAFWWQTLDGQVAGAGVPRLGIVGAFVCWEERMNLCQDGFAIPRIDRFFDTTIPLEQGIVAAQTKGCSSRFMASRQHRRYSLSGTRETTAYTLQARKPLLVPGSG